MPPRTSPPRLGPIQEKIRVCQKALASLKPIRRQLIPNGGHGPPTSMDAETAQACRVQAREVVQLSIKELGTSI